MDLRRPALLLALLASLVAYPARDGAAQQGGGLERFDRNGDKLLQRDEAPPMLTARFDELDTDQSGTLDSIELTRWLMSRAGEEGRDGPAPELPQGPASWNLIAATIEKMIADRGLDGAVYRVLHGDRVVYDRAFGQVQADTVRNVASATKWVTAAVFLSLADDGLVDLQAPIARYLPDLDAAIGRMTLAQMLSHTSGFPGISTRPIDLQLPVDITLSEAGEQVARSGLVHEPGTMFDYGGASFLLAGVVAEKVTGKNWEAVFQERIATPIGMQASFYGDPRAHLEGRRDLACPNLQAGLHTSVNDYTRFLRMVAHRGDLDGRRVLSAASIAEQERTRLRGVEKFYIPGGARAEFEYGLGAWCEVIEADGSCPVVSSPGAWGTYPWLDRRRDVVGLLFVKDRLPALLPYVERIRELTNQLVDAQR